MYAMPALANLKLKPKMLCTAYATTIIAMCTIFIKTLPEPG